jgi:pimeloyl-ACP methyl ester carboxylesterase
MTVRAVACSGSAVSGPTWREPRRRRWRPSPITPVGPASASTIQAMARQAASLWMGRFPPGLPSRSTCSRARHPRAADRIAGLVLIAPAADMTADLMWDGFPEVVRQEILTAGVWRRPSLYGEPYAITRRLIEDGRKHLLLGEGVEVSCPVRILQGDSDPDVPAAHAVKVFGAIKGTDVSLSIIKGGDHRLSTPQNLTLLRETVLRLAERADGITI